MNQYSWHTSKQKYDGGWYKCSVVIVFPGNTLKFESYPFYKPNRKGNNKAKRNKAFNSQMRSIYGRKWADVKKILKNTTEIHLRDIRGCIDCLTEILLTPTPIFELDPQEFNNETSSKEMAL